MLTATEIQKQIELRRIIIEPWDPALLNPNSVDVRLSPNLLRVTDPELDFRKPYNFQKLIIPEEGLWLKPGELYLGSTIELTYTPYHIPEYSGKSTTGRYFLFSHVTAGFGDVGFRGRWTLEIVCCRRVRIYVGMRIGQINFQTPEGELTQYYGQYANREGAAPGVPNNVLR